MFFGMQNLALESDCQLANVASWRALGIRACSPSAEGRMGPGRPDYTKTNLIGASLKRVQK